MYVGNPRTIDEFTLSKLGLKFVDEYNPGLESNLNLDMFFVLSELLDFEGDFKRPLSVFVSPSLTIWGQCFKAFPKKGFVTPNRTFGKGTFPEELGAVMSLKSLS